ncbi:MAG: hypothetical protein WBE74_25605 [Terracidiphilus sp.]
MSGFPAKTTILASLCACAGILSSQAPQITPDTHVDVPTLKQWLHGSEPRLVAWAADFARRNSDKRLIDDIPAVIETVSIPSPREAPSEQELVIDALLDALIEQDVRVPASAIARIANTYPAQALILISRLPTQEAESTLTDWTYYDIGAWEQRRLARVAAMMLAQRPKPEFVARIAAAAGQQLTVHIASTDSGYGGGSGTCGDYGAGRPRPGWPLVYNYDLVENDRQEMPLRSGSRLVIDLAGDRIVARRFEENQHPGSCYGVDPLNEVTRHRLFAYWLGVKPAEMSWQPRSEVAIVWADQAGYERKLGAMIGEQRNKMQEAIRGLQDRGLLTEEQADSISPKISVSIRCDISPCPLK